MINRRNLAWKLVLVSRENIVVVNNVMKREQSVRRSGKPAASVKKGPLLVRVSRREESKSV